MAVLKETRSFRPFKSSEEYLYAMKEDLAEWLNQLYPELIINVDNFMDRLDTGVALCKHANSVRKSAEEYLARRAARKMSTSMTSSTSVSVALPITTHGRVHFLQAAKAGTFFARDNVSNFIDWSRRGLGVFECLLFETDDLIMRKNEKHVILCLLDVARRGAKFGMLAPLLVQLEREIDREIAADQRALRGEQDGGSEEEEDELESEQYGPMPQIVTNDLKSLDEMVRELVERCRCPVQFPMIRVSEGKYRIGDTKVLIFVRILRNHVMVRVGGGWDTLSHYLDKHDPCRCKQQHRSPLSAKLILKNHGHMELNHAQVHYERSPPRTRRSSASSISSGGRPDSYHLNPPTSGVHTLNPPTSGVHTLNRSRSPTPRRNSTCKGNNNDSLTVTGRSTPNQNRSRSPTLRRNSVRSNNDSLTVTGRSTPNQNRSRSPTPRRNSVRSNNDSLTVTGRSTPNQNRSRSPTPRKSLQTTPRNRSRSPNPPSKTRKPSSSRRSENQSETTATRADNDSGSEVSDEGYRSLGIVVNKEVDPALNKRASFSSNASNDDECDAMNVDDDVTYVTSKTVTLQNTKPGKENNKPSGDEKKTSLPTDPRRLAPVSIPRSRSIDNGYQYDRRSIDDSRSSPVCRSNRSAAGNTWSSRAKQRPALNPNTFTNTTSKNPGLGARNSYQRSSLGSRKGTSLTTSPAKENQDLGDRNSYQRSSLGSRKSTSLTTSPTKEVSPLVKQILDVQDLDDDAKVLDKMKEIIQHYKDIVDERLVEEDKSKLDFTTTWVQNNGAIHGALDVAKKQATPRKDSKAESFSSKIPAPVSHRATADS